MLEYWELTLQRINIEGRSLAPNAGEILQAVTKDLDAGDGPAVCGGGQELGYEKPLHHHVDLVPTKSTNSSTLQVQSPGPKAAENCTALMGFLLLPLPLTFPEKLHPAQALRGPRGGVVPRAPVFWAQSVVLGDPNSRSLVSLTSSYSFYQRFTRSPETKYHAVHRDRTFL